MQKLKILKVQFDAQIAPYEVPAFRGAIAAKVPRDSILYHNHDGEKLRYGYPLIQYKRIGRNPTIICVGEGVEEIHKFFENQDWGIEISGRKLEMNVEDLHMNELTIQLTERQRRYELREWMPLSEESFREYNNLPTIKDKIAFLEKKITGNILSLAKGIGWTVQDQIKVDIIDIQKTSTIRFKKTNMIVFDLSFYANVFLPNYIGLGRKVGFGFGMVREQRYKRQY